jgi:hypothetical protein
MTDTNDDVTERDLVWKDAATGVEYRVPFADVPAKSLAVLCQRGFTHFLGNEQAAKLVGWKKKEENVNATDDEVKAFLKATRQTAFDAVIGATMGTRTSSGAPRATGIEAVMRRIAVEMLTVELAKRNVKLPTGDKTIEVLGKPYTRETLIETMLKRRDALIRQKAQERMSADGPSLFDEDDTEAA